MLAVVHLVSSLPVEWARSVLTELSPGESLPYQDWS